MSLLLVAFLSLRHHVLLAYDLALTAHLADSLTASKFFEPGAVALINGDLRETRLPKVFL